MFASDVYGKGYDASWYNYIHPIVGPKPMAIGECTVLPTPAVLAAQPRWVFFMAWSKLLPGTTPLKPSEPSTATHARQATETIGRQGPYRGNERSQATNAPVY